MGTGHINRELCDALVQLFHIANMQDSEGTLEEAMTSVRESCSAGDLSLGRLRTVALEANVDADRWRRRETELHALLRVAQGLLASSTLSESLDVIVGTTRSLLSADVAHINLHSGEKNDYHSVRAIQGEMTEAFRRQRTPAGAGLTGLVTETKSPYTSTDYLTDPRMRHSATGDASVRADGLRTLVGVPVLHRDDVIAVLIVSYRVRTVVSDEQLGLLVSLATLAGLTLEDAQLRDSQQAIARRIQDDSTLLKARNASLEWAASTCEDLMDLVLRDCGIDEFILAVADAFGCVAVISDSEGSSIARAPESSDLALQRDVLDAVGSGVEQVHRDGESLWLCGVPSQGAAPDVLCVRRKSLDEIEQRTLSRAGQLVGQVFRRYSNEPTPGEMDESTVVGLLDGRVPDDFTAGLARSLGFAVSQPFVVAVVFGDIAVARRMHHFGVRFARERHGAAGSNDGRLVLIIPGEDPDTVAGSVADHLSSSLGSPVTVGASVSKESTGIAPAASEALRCARCLRRMGHTGGSATVRSLGQVGLLLGSESNETLTHFIEESIGPLIEYDRKRQSDLVGTLHAYLAHNGSLKTAAAELHVHPNTVLQRLQKISALLGNEDWRNRSENRLDLQLALRLHKISLPGKRAAQPLENEVPPKA